MYGFSIEYRYSSDILLKIHKLQLLRVAVCQVCCNHSCYYVDMVSVTSVSRYVTSASRYHSRFSVYIRGLIPRNSPSQLRLGFLFVCFFVCFLALRTKSTAMAMAGRSVHITTLFPAQLNILSLTNL